MIACTRFASGRQVPRLTPKSPLLNSGNECLWLIKLAALFVFFAAQVHGQTSPSLRGHVFDRADFPITGASVSVKSADKTLGTTSDSHGYFELVVPPGTYELNVSARGGFETRAIKSLRITGSRTVTVILDVAPSTSVYDPVPPAKGYNPGKLGERLDGFVMDEFGAVISDATVTLRSAKKNLQTKSDAAGRFTFGRVRSGRYTIIVSGEGFRAKTIEGVRITSEDPASLRVTLDAADSP